MTVCPLATYSYQPQHNFNYPAATEVLFGGSIGARPYITTSVKLIPFVGVGLLRSTFKDGLNERAEFIEGRSQTGAENLEELACNWASRSSFAVWVALGMATATDRRCFRWA